MRPAVVTNSGAVMAEAICNGLALGVIPSFALPPEHLDAIELLLPEWTVGQRGIYVVYPHRRFVPSKVRAFVESLRTALGDGSDDPWWPASIPVPGSGKRRRS